MLILILLIGLLIGLTIGYIISKKITTKKIYKKLNSGTGKMGLIRIHNSFSSARGNIEIEELQVAGEMTKILIHNILPDRDSKTKGEDLLKSWGCNDWVKTSIIVWYDDNAQRIRDNKLKEILG